MAKSYHYMTMEEATERAEAVRRLMTHPEMWDVKVHKNHGSWHWSLRSGSVNLHESRYIGPDVTDGDHSSFWTLMGRRMGEHGGNPDWGLPNGSRFADPNDAVKAQVECARVHVDQLIASVEHGESLL